MTSEPENSSYVADYRTTPDGVRALLAFGLTQSFFEADAEHVKQLLEALNAGYADLESRFGVTVLGTLDDDEFMVGARSTWPWTCYVLLHAPSYQAIKDVCNLLRQIPVGEDRLWKYMTVEARTGRPLFFVQEPATTSTQ